MMLQFAYPWSLLFLMAVPPIVWYWLKRPRRALRYPDLSGFAALPPGRSRIARWGGAALRGGALALVILALAGPRVPDQRTRIPTEGVALEMVVDVSGSMATRDFTWDGKPISRLDAAKRAFRWFVAGGNVPSGETLTGRPSDLIGLVEFATWPDSVCPLTLSHSVLLRLLEEARPRSVPGESETNLSDALALGLHRLQNVPSKRKVLILITDGEHNVPKTQSEWTPLQAAQIAANLQIPIYTIDAGSESGVDEDAPGERRTPGDLEARTQVRARAESTLRSVAAITHGRYFQARDTDALIQACQDIDRLEKEEIESFQYRRYFEGFTILGLLAFGLLMLMQLLEMTLWRRVP